MSTIAPDEGAPEPPARWWNVLVRFIGPAFYVDSWNPWLRIVMTAVLVFAGYIVLRLIT